MNSEGAATQATRSDIRAIGGLAAAVVVPLLPIGRWIAPGDSLSALLIHEGVWWSYAAAVLLWLRFGEGLLPSTIGFRRLTGKGLLCALGAAAALMAVLVIHSAVVVPLFHLDAGKTLAERDLILGRPFWYRLIMVLRAAVVEEILFRGYMIEKVLQLTGSAAAGVALSVATFTYAHLSGWGPVQLIPVFFGGLIFALLYVWRRDLPSNMVAHFITDGAGFLIG